MKKKNKYVKGYVKVLPQLKELSLEELMGRSPLADILIKKNTVDAEFEIVPPKMIEDKANDQ